MRASVLAGLIMLCFAGRTWAGEAPPLPVQCGVHEYPHEAANYGLEGVTTVDYSLAPDGRVVDLSVKRSSGWQILDEGAVMSLAGCRMARAPEADALEKRKSVDYVWSLEAPRSRQTLVPGSCMASDRVAGFRPFDKTPSSTDGILVRSKVHPNGEPRFVMAECGDVPAELAAVAVAYLRSCKFKLAAGDDSPSDDAIFGRVLFK